MIRKRTSLCYLLALLISLSLVFSGCSHHDSEAEAKPARYGSFGADFAVELARSVPQRGPGSSGERQAAELIKAAFEGLGYQVELQPFSFYLNSGQQAESQNLIIKIPGRGFKLESNYDPNSSILDSQRPPAELSGRKLYIMAHYDSYASESEYLALSERSPALPNFNQADGIHDNSAAVAVLLSLAKELKSHQTAYDIVLVLLGAGHSDYAGASALLSTLSAEDKNLTDCVVNLSNIYAGDKIYAHAGQNSVTGEHSKNYALRRKLYEVTDIYYNNLLLTHNNFAIYTNQSTEKVTHPSLGIPVLYREWTLVESDHSVFDRAGYPIVFIQSGQYDFNSEQQSFRESTDPFFNASGGRIAGSGFDSTQILLPHFAVNTSEQNQAARDNNEEPDEAIDLLSRNINNLAFVLLELADKTPPYCEIK
ncbi:MAG: M28 family peptidase [Eubacteriales bacterium]|nr:M28 family peptidase [Eubacteriales bacterium]